MDYEAQLIESFGGNIDKIKDSLMNHIHKCLIEVVQNICDITTHCETDKQRFILVNSLVLSVIVNIAKWKLNNELSVIQCGHQSAELSRELYLMNKSLFENTSEQIKKELDEVFKSRIKTNPALFS
jgi:hypothetical protein